MSVGLGAVIARSDALYTRLRFAGAAYLVALGVGKIRDRRALAGAFGAAPLARTRLRTTIREGFVVGATNPKGLLIFTAVLPQFIDRARGHETLQLLTLGAICVAIALLSDGAWAIFSGSARSWLGRSPRRLGRLSATGGVMMIGLGVGLAVTGGRRG